MWPSNEVLNGKFHCYKLICWSWKKFSFLSFRFLEVGLKKMDFNTAGEIFVRHGHTHGSYFWHYPVTSSWWTFFNGQVFLTLEAFFGSFKTVLFVQNPKDSQILKTTKSSLSSCWEALQLCIEENWSAFFPNSTWEWIFWVQSSKCKTFQTKFCRDSLKNLVPNADLRSTFF